MTHRSHDNLLTNYQTSFPLQRSIKKIHFIQSCLTFDNLCGILEEKSLKEVEFVNNS